MPPCCAPTRLRAALLLTALLLTASLQAADRPPAPLPPAYALLIGVSEYEHAGLPPLTYAENDVEQLAKLLDRPGSPFYTRVRLLTTARGKKTSADQPTAANVKAAVEKVLANRTRHETVLVALAGHGVQLLVPDSQGKGEDRSYGYFCPADAQLGGADYRTGRSDRLVLLSELLQRLGDCGAGGKLLLMDACRNQLRLKQRSLTVRRDMVPDGVAALFSCRPGEVSFEAEQLKHGVFFHFLLEGLRGGAKNRRGEVTWARLAEYVTDKVTEEAADLIGTRVTQTPHLVANLAGRSPLLLGPTSEAERLYRRGLDLYDGTGGKVDRREAIRLFRRAAEGGFGAAQLAVAVALSWVAFETDQSDDEAARWAEKGLAGERQRAATGDPDAQRWVGGAYEFGIGVAKDRQVAARWYRKAAEQGDPWAQVYLGWCYLHGRGVGKDDLEAVRWFRRAVDQGHAPAHEALGYCYQHARGLARDEAMATELYRKSAEGGYIIAQNVLGWRYLMGTGTPKDEQEAVRWLRQAAAQEFAAAQNNLGLCHLNGWGMPLDEATAASWFRKGANQQNQWAMYNLGWCYDNGRGVGRDVDQAKRWYQKAADRGHTAARKRLKELE